MTGVLCAEYFIDVQLGLKPQGAGDGSCWFGSLFIDFNQSFACPALNIIIFAEDLAHQWVVKRLFFHICITWCRHGIDVSCEVSFWHWSDLGLQFGWWWKLTALLWGTSLKLRENKILGPHSWADCWGWGFYFCQTLWTQGRTVNMNMVKILAVLDCSCWESNVYILIYTLLVYLYAWTCCLIIGGELCIELFFFFLAYAVRNLGKYSLEVLLRNVKGCYSWFLPQNHAVSKLSCWWSLVHCKAWSVAS